MDKTSISLPQADDHPDISGLLLVFSQTNVFFRKKKNNFFHSAGLVFGHLQGGGVLLLKLPQLKTSLPTKDQRFHQKGRQ